MVKYTASKFLAGAPVSVRKMIRPVVKRPGLRVPEQMPKELKAAFNETPVVRRPMPDISAIEQKGREMRAYDEAFDETRMMSYIMGGRRHQSRKEKDKK